MQVYSEVLEVKLSLALNLCLSKFQPLVTVKYILFGNKLLDVKLISLFNMS